MYPLMMHAKWHYIKYKVRLERDMVLPVLHALQGHPESGRCWESHINKILSMPDLQFKSTTHDRCIYRATYEGIPIYLLCQVDDFALAASNEDIAKAIYKRIGNHLKLPSETTVPIKYLGPLTEFNGVDVTQYNDSIVVSCHNYIDRVLKTHSWTTPAPNKSKYAGSPLPTDCISQLYSEPGYAKASPEHSKLIKKHNFGYRQLPGELLYAYVTCRPDIGYAVITLSKFASKPGDFHFHMLKHVAIYLRRTKHWGIIYHRPLLDLQEPQLPPNPQPGASVDSSLPDFPSIDPHTLTCFVDAAHGNNLDTRRSTTGYGLVLAGGCVSYRCKTQTATATSSMEAEFYAAVSVAKQAKYLRAVLTELGFQPSSPTILFCDNESTIKMVYSRIPTERSHYI
ncbi:unnamed protein product [Cylindrotheca closterium]|uniref:Reverse transcriptase Ty1/copia-type domain-containing protein n=1 Tax=Cylindrotheca closterium TaxID=2856 RepID=A0AAD2G4E9_9STRA|nr:unnamed protein product [Cylindrotheca closterium]